MKKYRIRIDKEGKYYLEFKSKGRFFEGKWKQLDYFFSLEDAKNKIDELLGKEIVHETEWIK